MIGMLSPDKMRLVMLDGSGAAVIAKEDVRGLDVKDRANDKVGEVDDLVIDVSAGRVRLLKVGSGGVLGIGRDHRLVPVDVVESVAGDSIFLTAMKALVKSTPTWGDIDGEAFLTEVYRHYGCRPFWSEGYQEPDWIRSE